MNTKKNKHKKFSTKKIIPLVLIPLVGIGGVTTVYKYGNEPVETYNQQNQIHNIEKVKEDLLFYGGDPRYVDKNLTLFGLKKTKLHTHLNIGEDRAVRIGFSDNLSEEYKQQFTHTFNYVNSIFEIINPRIRFEITSENKENCDVWIQKSSLNKRIGMQIKMKYDMINGSQIKGAIIHINDSIELTTAHQRFFMLHEVMHLLTGSSDVNYTKSPTFSVFNYNDVSFIVDQLNNSSKLSKYKNSWVSYLPTDIGTLIALYGDSSVLENKQAYIELLNNTLSECGSIFGTFQPFFKKDFIVPTNEDKADLNNKDDDLSY